MKMIIGWLYPELMSTYSDRGNIICLTKRCLWRGIESEIISIDQSTKDFKKIDLLFGGGAQDRQQEIVTRDLYKKKEIIKTMIDDNLPSLFTCGSYQLMGSYYEPSAGKRIEGLGIIDMATTHPGSEVPRCIGNIAGTVLADALKDYLLVGFENHGGRTKLGNNTKPFIKVIKGFGNNGEDGYEGALYKNVIGTYFHGPVLPKNPLLADYLIKIALSNKYKETIKLKKIDDCIENQARSAVLKKLNISYNV